MTKPKRPIPNQRLQASARRAMPTVNDEYEEEPSMKLSSAFVVVLLLHVVAVGGIYAFTRIKEHRANHAAPFAQAQAAELAEAQGMEAGSASHARVHEVRPGDTLIRIANSYGVGLAAIEEANGLHDVEVLRVGQEIRIPAAVGAPSPALRPLVTEPVGKKPVTASISAPPRAGGAADSGETYTVEKGDNPVAIARKFNVRYSDLIELNRIGDPRLLQIGQKLKLPKKRD